MKQPSSHRIIQAYLDGLAPGSQAAMRDSLKVLAAFFGPATPEDFPWHELRYERVQEFRAYSIAKYKSRTTNRHIAALRGVLASAWRLGLMSTDDYHHARDVKLVKVSEPPAGRQLSLTELRRLINFKGGDRRDSALITVLYAAGLRRFEAAKLRVADYDREIGQITVRSGKRGKSRQVTINKKWRSPIETWLDEYQPRATDPLFPSYRSGKIVKKPLSATGVAFVLEQRRLETGVAPFSTHDMRRTFLTNLIALGVDLVIVQRIAGHDHVDTTARYDRRDHLAEVAAVERLEGLAPDKPRKK